MYRRPKFLEALLEIRREMAREADYDVELFAETARSGRRPELRPETSCSEPAVRDDIESPRLVGLIEGSGS